jgi:hypothetical protein
MDIANGSYGRIQSARRSGVVLITSEKIRGARGRDVAKSAGAPRILSGKLVSTSYARAVAFARARCRIMTHYGKRI